MTPLEKILVVISIDEDQAAVLNRAVSLAKKNQASLSVFSVVSPPPGFSILAKTGSLFAELLEDAVERTRTELEMICEKLRTDTGQEVTSKVLVGKEDLAVVAEAKRTKCDLVLKGCKASGGLLASVFGTSDMNLMRRCPCPVLILKPTEVQNFRTILVAVDKDDDAPENHLLNLKILRLASWLALADSSELHILHVWSYPFESLLRSPRSSVSSSEAEAMVAKEEQARSQWLYELLGEMTFSNQEAMDYLSPQLHSVKGEADLRIVEKTIELDADLVVMGTVGRVGIPGFLMGNTSETILQHLKCSCLTVKPPGFGEAAS